MGTKTAIVRARIEPDLKKEAELVLKEMGLTPTEAIRLFFTQVKLQKRLPFRIELPNEQTQRAIREANERDNMTKFENPDELFEDIGI